MRIGTVHPISISSGPRSEDSPLDFELLKTHLSVTTTDLDDVITLWEQVAIEWAEDFMQRSIMPRQHRFVIEDFPRCGNVAVRLPMGRAISVDSIEYSDGGNSRTMYGPSSGSPGGSDFQEDLNDESGALIMPNRNASWPSVDHDVTSPVIITLTTGWPDAESVPTRIKHALMFTVADLLELRGSNDIAAQVASNGSWLLTRQNLLASWVVRRVY